MEGARGALEEAQHPLEVLAGARHPGVLLGPPGEGLGQVAPLEQGHREVRDLAVDLRLEHGADAGVRQARDALGFSAQARAALVGDEGAHEQLEGDRALDARVLRPPDGALAPAAELLDQPIGPDATLVDSRIDRLGCHLLAHELGGDRLLVARIALQVLAQGPVDPVEPVLLEVGEKVEDGC